LKDVTFFIVIEFRVHPIFYSLGVLGVLGGRIRDLWQISSALQQLSPSVPDPKIEPSCPMECNGAVERHAPRQFAAIGRATEARCALVDAASVLAKVDAVAVDAMRQHQRSGDERMRLRPILRRIILRHQEHGIVLAAERAAIAGNGARGLR
jgi:hypothetical protein